MVSKPRSVAAIIERDRALEEAIAALAADKQDHGHAIAIIKALRAGKTRIGTMKPPFSYVQAAVKVAHGNLSGFASIETPLGTLEVDHFKTDSGYNRTEYRLDGERVSLRTLDLMGLNQRRTRARRTA